MNNKKTSQELPPRNSSDMIIAAEENETKPLTPERYQRIETVVRQRQRGLMVVMEAVWNPHNLAAIARSCDAFGVQELAFTPRMYREEDIEMAGNLSSASAAKWLDYRVFENDSISALTTLKAEGWHLVATTLSERAVSIHDIDFAAIDRIALLIGNEKDGLSQEAQELADTHIVIPMMGMVRSFNVSVATAISLYEITRQRAQTGRDYGLPQTEADVLLKRWLERE